MIENNMTTVEAEAAALNKQRQSVKGSNSFNVALGPNPLTNTAKSLTQVAYQTQCFEPILTVLPEIIIRALPMISSM